MNKFIFIFAALITASTSAYAKEQFTLSPSLIHFDYAEFSTTDKLLNRELGWLPGIETRLRYPIGSRLLIDAHTSYYRSSVDYVGQTQSGVPHNTDTRTSLFRLGARAELAIYQDINLFFSAQSHRWKRGIKDSNNISGIDETYQWLEYSIGFSSSIITSDKNTLILEAGLLATRQVSMDVDLSRVGLGAAELDLGNGTGTRLSLLWRPHFKDNFRYGIDVFFESWEFGRSNTKRTEGGASSVFVTEPRSETQNIGLKLNLEYGF